MAKVILGSVAGGFVAAALMLGAWMMGQSNAAPAGVNAAVPMATAAAPTVSCAPTQHAAVARVLVNGQEMATLACVERAPLGAVAYGAAPQFAPQYAYAPAPQPAPVYRTPVQRVAYRPASDDVVRYEPDVRQQTRSVAKTAMVIGGSAGAGAGVGGLVGGKKGALIGAAIGGGAASIFEATKR
jgi:hypothetical protein